MVFDEGNMEEIENAINGTVPKAIGLRIGSITDENTRNGAMMKFWVVSGNESKGLTANLS